MLVFLVMGSAWFSEATAQESLAWYDYVRSDLKWYTIETEHFLVHFHSDETGEGSRTARVVSEIAEDMYGPITDLYDFEMDQKVSFVLKDYEDYSNGAAYFFDNIIEIWAPALNTPFRGDHNWLRNVISHEFTHMVQVQKTMKTTRKLPFMYLQFLNYEKVTRPDVLYGFPNVLASYPIPILNNPAWLAEGSAQYQRASSDYDRWDSHRDMMLRTQILAGEELTLAEMGGFYSHTSLMRESVYNHGFAFSLYLANRFGEDGLRTLSAELGKWSNWNFEQAAFDAFGIRGEDIYTEWITSLRAFYSENAPPGTDSEVKYIERDGFNNFYARVSRDGSKVAYISNKGEDFSSTGIWIHSLTEENGSPKMTDVHGSAGISPSNARLILSGEELGFGSDYTCSLGHKLLSAVSGPIDWISNTKLVYSKSKDTPEGYLYLDLWSYDIETEEKVQLTRNARASSPSVSKDGSFIAFVTQYDGTTNLQLLDVASGETKALTNFVDGSQVTEPVFDHSDEWIYFGLSIGHGRDIYRVNRNTKSIEPVMAEVWDDRSPAFDQAGNMVFSSDRSGIFNLYRRESSGEIVQLTVEQGGAFMPSFGPDGNIVYSRYEASGYKIAAIKPEVRETSPSYQTPPFLAKTASKGDISAFEQALNSADDAAIRTFSAAEMESVKAYRPVFTSVSFLPVLRLDQYVSRKRSRTDVRLKDRTRAETLWRNTKVGMYASTREVLGGFTFFGGLLLGPGSGNAKSLLDGLSPSNLLDLERDAILQVDYAKGLPFIHKRWSPQFSAQLFNIRRNVENGLAIEEFPCTACYPDSTLADLAYDLWEVDFTAKSKINRVLLAQVGYRYSPYRVTTKRFFSEELKQAIPASSSKYYIGRAFHASLIFESFHPYRDMNVVPTGIRAELSYERESGRLLEAFSIRDGLLTPLYANATVNRISFDVKGGLRLPGWPGEGAHGLGLRLRTTAIIGREVDDFYNDYVGGLVGARGYAFYALGGNETVWAQISYSFPVFPRVSKQFLFTYVDKIYLKVYADAATAWSGDFPGLGSLKKDVGVEARFGLGSFYLLPAAFFISSTYGLDSFNFQLDEGFVTPDGSSTIRYGGTWQWHVGLLFGFDQL
ncbi:MAG: hypothetical protein O3B41_00835 [Bacteroidetes bacterium]|nr:hypothetical protein [Bacteroidota bacterium]